MTHALDIPKHARRSILTLDREDLTDLGNSRQNQDELVNGRIKLPDKIILLEPHKASDPRLITTQWLLLLGRIEKTNFFGPCPFG